MIVGLGADLCDIRRIEAALARHGARFEARVFTAGEQAKARARQGDSKRNGVASTYAKRFAAKEACGKALGTGVGVGSHVYWRDIEVVNLPGGKPTLLLGGKASAALAQLTPPGCRMHVHVTLTDEYPLAQAFVVLEALPL